MFIQSCGTETMQRGFMSAGARPGTVDATEQHRRHLLGAVRVLAVVLAGCGLWAGVYLAITTFG